MELWKSIAGYEGLYEVSNLGRVKSLARVVFRSGKRGCDSSLPIKERILSPALSKGYPLVQLRREGRGRPFKVHTLVALAFVGPRPSPKHEVRHRDGTRHNARADNLEWGTRRENMADAVLHGTVVGPNNGYAKLSADNVIEILDEFENLANTLAERFGVHPGTIKNVRRGRTYQSIVGRS